MCRMKNVPAAIALPLADENMAEATETTTTAASQGGRTFITSQGTAWSGFGRLGFSLKVYIPAMPTTTENTAVITPAVTMLHLAPPSVLALYIVNLRPGSAIGLRTNTSIKLATFQPPYDSTPRKEE